MSAPETVTCFGDGTSGPRVEALHIVSASDNVSTPTARLRQFSSEVSRIVEESSRRHGGPVLTMRFTHDSSCRPTIEKVVVPSNVFNGTKEHGAFFDLTGWLGANGYDSKHRKYLLYVNGNPEGICGLGTFTGDEQGGSANRSDWGTGYAYVAQDCWGYAETHEIFHTLGAVGYSSPNSSGAGHCVDVFDIMCYDDGGPSGRPLKSVCAQEWGFLLDCNGDDYFNPRPPAGSYLDNFRNTAESRFLGPVSGAEPNEEPIWLSLSAPKTLLTPTKTSRVVAEATLIHRDHGDVMWSDAHWEPDFVWESDMPTFRALEPWSPYGPDIEDFCHGACGVAQAVPNGRYDVKVSVVYEGKTYSASQSVVVGDTGAPPPPPTSFSDVDSNNTFAGDIVKLADAGITRGCNPPTNDRFCPSDHVTRGQMAAFLGRALELEPANVSFVETAGHNFESDISALASAGITRGCNPPANDRFCPDDPVTRGQMAAFLVRALGLPSGNISFADTSGHTFEADIAALASADITRGCNPPANDRFCPDDRVTRGQMAAFLVRAGLAG